MRVCHLISTIDDMAGKEKKISFMYSVRFGISLILALALASSLTSAAKKKVTIYASPDRKLGAEIMSVDFKGNGNESSVVIRRPDRKVVVAKNFLSKDHEHGLGVMKAAWTYDSRFFIFSTTASGGQLSGRFPTFIYVRAKNAILPLDPLVGMWITRPDFDLQAPNLLFVTVHDTLNGGLPVDTIYKRIHLDELFK